jgi:hypothetical protein
MYNPKTKKISGETRTNTWADWQSESKKDMDIFNKDGLLEIPVGLDAINDCTDHTR